MLVEMAHQVASVGVRNRATVVGNLCSAVPSLDAGPVLLVYDADRPRRRPGGRSNACRSPSGSSAPKQTQLGAGEIVTAVTLHLPAGDHGAVFLKLSRYSGEDLAQANLAVLMTAAHEYRLAFGAVAPVAVPGRRRSRPMLLGKPLDDRVIAEARALVPATISPITDVRATAEYRTHMCGVMLERGLRAAASRLAGDGPPYPAHLI